MKRLAVVAASVLLIIAGSLTVTAYQSDEPTSCGEYYANMENPPALAQAWCEAGSYFTWQSTLPQNADFAALNIFQICEGNPEDPAILLIHGYPTYSFDWAPLFERLSDDHYLCALDTPGYGFSDKPLGGYDYSIFDDAQLVDYYVREIAGIDNFTLVTHDKGNSVGLAFLQVYQAYDERPYTIEHHVINNGNIYLPLAQLTDVQLSLLDDTSGPVISRLITPEQMAGSLQAFYSTPLPEEEIAAMVSVYAYQNGNLVLHEITKYLNERMEFELDWLGALAASDIPTTMIWGEEDMVAPVAVADEVWANFLADRPAPASYWRIPCGNHYVQFDQPDLVVEVMMSAVEDASVEVIDGTDCSATRLHLNTGE